MLRLALLIPTLLTGCSGVENDSSDWFDTNAGDPNDLDGDGYRADADDCDDTDPTVHPGAGETYYDGVDNDCDPATIDDDQDADGVSVDVDCNDYDPAVNPDAVDLCDGVDNNCDGSVDEAPGLDGWIDADGDGYGDAAHPVTICDVDPVPVDNDTDCNDAEPAAFPGNPEVCDAIDNDCNGVVDDGATDATPWYADADEDGFGDAAAMVTACSAPPGSVSDGTDCDDGEASVHPDATEADNGVDDDCDAFVDEDFVLPGDLVFTEFTGEPTPDAVTVPDAQWFEVYNASARTVDLSDWYVARAGSAMTAGFYIDPAERVSADPGEYLVFCKTDAYESSSGAAYPLACDYVWGDPDEASTWSGAFHDNTFELQAGDDSVGLYLGGDPSTGVLVDGVAWSEPAWPRADGRSLALEPSLLDSTSNDLETSWCSTPSDAAYTWWASGVEPDYGTPGSANPTCP